MRKCVFIPSDEIYPVSWEFSYKCPYCGRLNTVEDDHIMAHQSLKCDWCEKVVDVYCGFSSDDENNDEDKEEEKNEEQEILDN